MPSDDAIRTAMVELAESFTTSTDLDETLGGVTAAALNLIDEIDFADIMLIKDGQFRSVAPTDPLLVELDGRQMALNEGPCLEATTEDSVVRSPDLSRDTRWPAFADSAIAAGVHGMLSFQLYTRQGGAGALNLFSLAKLERFKPETEALGAILATHAAAALMATDQHNQMQSALASRDLIGQAKGVLMERFKVDAVKAFDMLRTLSQDTNTPLRILAARVVETM
jgi:hypothetical protein